MKIECEKCGTANLDNARFCCSCGAELPKPKVEAPALPGVPTGPGYPKPPRSNNKKVMLIVSAIAAFLLASAGTRYAIMHFITSPEVFDKVLQGQAAQLNKSCPVMIDRITRFDSASALPGKAFQYNYTLVVPLNSQLRLDSLLKADEPAIISSVKQNPQMEGLRKFKTTFIYSYRDVQGNPITEIRVTPEMYQ